MNTTQFNSFFEQTILDNNGIPVTDINAGLVKLFTFFNDQANNLGEVQNYLVREHEEAYPDLIAINSAYGDQEFWWWLLLLNRLEDPFTQLKASWVYSINSPEQVNNLINAANQTDRGQGADRAGTIVELN